ncbi:Phosphoinositide phospholipase C [Pleurostoma richardsiae]|uniref:Phosphoinositide phospholipase C n=1 Tax=Pleurostoma richardsiae TaxID=41990 RepID=A0AA38RUX1_9PEZI|nr:Phosphoinositide phospholipase C [Pleurostoma richardsiae]
MSVTTYSNHDRPAPSAPSRTSTMPSQTAQLRRTRPSQVQTSFPQTAPRNLPSAVSASSAASSPQQCSPTLTPETTGRTTSMSSSMQPSPEPLRGRELEQLSLPADFQLPQSLVSPHQGLSRRTSTTSLGQSVIGTQGAMAEVMGGKTNIIRRLSNRVQKGAARLPGRRQSSVQPNSRDVSVGPGILRRNRSDSNNTAPPDYAPVIDSEEDIVDDKEDNSLFAGETLRDFWPGSAAVSISGSTTPSDTHAGPVIPLALLQGTWIAKVSKKNRKRIPLVLEPDAGKITWDKTRPNKTVYIDDIKEIRVVPDIRQYRLDCGVSEGEEPRFFSILYAVPDKSGSKTMHLIADDDETFNNWVTTLDAISKHRQDLMSSLMAFNDKAISAYWQKEMARRFADKPRFPDDEEIDFAGVERVCRNLHIHVSVETLKSKFDEAHKSGTQRLNFAEFQEFVRLMKRREDVRSIYREFASNPETGMTLREFLNFLRSSQGESVDDDVANWEAIFYRFSRRCKSRALGKLEGTYEEIYTMSEAALVNYLTSTYNLHVVKAPQEFLLDRPMNEYFISSSHNTYLLGRQVAGNSSVEGYISALMRGCRCVEIDCWDGPERQPIVVHGRTMTSQIKFREVINAINKYAFTSTQFPLWISLEVHCNPIQQEVMANIMIEVFGDKLVRQVLDEFEDRLPSPSALKGRILVKVKKPQLAEDLRNGEVNGRRRGNSLTSPYPRPVHLDNSSIPNSPLLGPSHGLPRRMSNTARRVNTITEGEIQELSSSTSDDSEEERGPHKKRQSKITKVLGDLGVYCLGVKFTGFDDPECKAFNHILSFKERTFAKHSENKGDKRALYRHNMRYMMRVYPNQYRITSSNFDPLIYWRRGVQMAALNWQTFDVGMHINRAMFEGGTDQSGYVLKPNEFREIQVMPNLPEEWIGKRQRKNVSFTIDVISAQQLMRPSNLGERRTVDPYVEVEVFLADDKSDKQEKSDSQSHPQRTPLRYHTQIIPQNGFNPIFNRKFHFNFTTKYPDLVFIRWSVKLSEGGNYNDKSSPLATFTAKLGSLKQGYRTLPLLDHNGDRYLFSTLFCRIKVDPITNVYVNYVEDADNTNKLRSLGRTVFNRSSNMSPKSSMDNGTS